MADSLEIVAIRLAGWNENVEEETDHHTEYRVETTVRRNLTSSVVTTYSRYRHFAALHAELQRCMPGHPSFAADFPVPKLVFHTDAAKRERADALSRYLNDVVLATSCPETPMQSLSRDPRGGRPPGALCRFLGVAEAPLTSTRRSSTSGINEITEYRDDDGSSIAV